MRVRNWDRLFISERLNTSINFENFIYFGHHVAIYVSQMVEKL